MLVMDCFSTILFYNYFDPLCFLISLIYFTILHEQEMEIGEKATTTKSKAKADE